VHKPDIGAPPWRASLWSAIAVVLLAAGVNLISSSRLAAFRDSTQHSEHIVAGLSAFRAHLVDAETGQRGYLLTGQAAYLDPYRGARSRVRQDLVGLDSLLTRDGSSRDALARLKGLSTEKLSELDSTISLRQHDSPSAAMAIVQSDRGKVLMDSARSVVWTLNAGEDSLMTAGRKSEERWAKYALFGLLVGAAISLAAMTHLLRTLWVYEQSQHAAQREMNQQITELERLARERMTSPSANT
jgi:CHASE3 domain sensor protein